MKSLLLSTLVAAVALTAFATEAQAHPHRVCHFERHHHERVCHWVR